MSMNGRANGIDAGDREVLTAWAHARRPRLARRAWIVLEEGAGVRERRLAEATPLSSARVQALVTGYRKHGLLGLVDAPRSGRPMSVPAQTPEAALRWPAGQPSMALPLNPDVLPHRDTVWRLAREQGVNIDRHRWRHVAWPAVADSPWAYVHGVAAGPSVSVVFAGPVRDEKRTSGTWLYPQFDALTPDTELGTGVDWRVVLEALGKSDAGPDKPRPVQERRGLLLNRVMSRVKTLPVVDVLVGGDPLSAEFLGWLVALRAVEADLGIRGPRLQVRGAASFTTWRDLLCAVLLASPDRSQAGRREDERVAKSLWRPSMHFWWHRGSP